MDVDLARCTVHLSPAAPLPRIGTELDLVQALGLPAGCETPVSPLLSAPAAPSFHSRSAHSPVCHLEAISPFISSPPFILGSWLQLTVLRLALTRLRLLY
jgi:hypothetical protein